jgi:hypothetical protein
MPEGLPCKVGFYYFESVSHGKPQPIFVFYSLKPFVSPAASQEDNVYCFSKTCNKRCSVTTLRGPPALAAPAPAPAELSAAPTRTPTTSTPLSSPPPAAAPKYPVPSNINSEKKKRKYSKGEMKCFEWEPNVTADCHPSDVLVPFTYIKDRIYSLDGNGEYVVERRCEGRCNCKRSLESLLTVRGY